MPSRYSQNAIVSLQYPGLRGWFHCSYFIKQLPNGFPSSKRDPCPWAKCSDLGCCSTFGKRKNTLACGSSIFNTTF
jgi:hypothetical protein